jgi:hypothetical protein
LHDDSIWCRFCRRRRQEQLAAGLQALTPVGAVVEELDVPRLGCRCGGDPEAPGHEDSLLHRRAVWAETQANTEQPPDRVTLEFARRHQGGA